VKQVRVAGIRGFSAATVQSSRKARGAAFLRCPKPASASEVFQIAFERKWAGGSPEAPGCNFECKDTGDDRQTIDAFGPPAKSSLLPART